MTFCNCGLSSYSLQRVHCAICCRNRMARKSQVGVCPFFKSTSSAAVSVIGPSTSSKRCNGRMRGGQTEKAAVVPWDTLVEPVQPNYHPPHPPDSETKLGGPPRAGLVRQLILWKIAYRSIINYKDEEIQAIVKAHDVLLSSKGRGPR